jgi:hypothetical protein
MDACTKDLTDGISDFGILTTGVPLLNNANTERFFQNIQEKYPDYTIATTGHSLGGKQAELIAMKYDVTCWSYNPGAGLPTTQAFQQNNFNNHNAHINRFLIQSDILSFMNSIQSAQGPDVLDIRCLLSFVYFSYQINQNILFRFISQSRNSLSSTRKTTHTCCISPFDLTYLLTPTLKLKCPTILCIAKKRMKTTILIT